ncbi:hypothetical protein [Eubacterium aggregans]|uniref:hypothetical protein n=1 Tax=Eubacterium aggregans TaxID=81409 RepID=UPI003F322CE8
MGNGKEVTTANSATDYDGKDQTGPSMNYKRYECSKNTDGTYNVKVVAKPTDQGSMYRYRLYTVNADGTKTATVTYEFGNGDRRI